MKKITVFLVLVLCTAAVLSAQTPSVLGLDGGSVHYEILASPGSADGPSYSAEMEQRFAAYTSVFRFDPALLSAPLKVRVFTNQNEYDAYVTDKLGSVRPGAVYLHYNDISKRELVVLRGSPGEAQLLPHQAFVQYLRAFIPNPPPWIREGFAVYFNTLVWDRERKTLSHEENTSWLETVKRSTVNIETVLLAKDGTVPAMQAFSWSLVSFLTADKEGAYYRSLTDSLMLLSPGARAEENTQAVYKRLTLFSPLPALTRDYNTYIASKKTFADLVEDGQKAYGTKNFSLAKDCFQKAAKLKPAHYAPFYYLGLLAYEDKRYNDAEDLYKTALDCGAERGLVQYARGVNAAASGKTSEAIQFLNEASAADPAAYRARSEDLIKKLRN